jgi:hypothetical protein
MSVLAAETEYGAVCDIVPRNLLRDVERTMERSKYGRTVKSRAASHHLHSSLRHVKAARDLDINIHFGWGSHNGVDGVFGGYCK